MINNIRVIALLLALISCNIAVQAQDLDKTRLDQYFQALNDNNKFMGNVSVFRNGHEIYSKSVGFADIESQTANSASAKCCIGSISKMFTAVMIFQVIEAGKLSLTQTVDKYFSTIENAEKITIGQLLSHRSGIYNFTVNGEFMKWSAKTRKQMIDIIAAGDSDFEPDTNADYSNSNYVLLSYILESLYEKPYADILVDQIIRPLSLTNTYFGRSIVDIWNNECNSYFYSDKWLLQTATDPSVTLGAGGIVSTPADLNKFADALFNGKLISPNSLSAMQNIRDDIGMGLFPVPYFSKLGYGHRGGVDGFNSMLIYMPEDKISYAITSNYLNNNFTEIHIAVLNCLYGQLFDIPTSEPVIIKSEILNKYTGTYLNSQFQLKVFVTKIGDTLSVQIPEQPLFMLEPASKHIFRLPQEDIVVEFNAEQKTMVLIKEEDVFYFEKEK